MRVSGSVVVVPMTVFGGVRAGDVSIPDCWLGVRSVIANVIMHSRNRGPKVMRMRMVVLMLKSPFE